MKSYTFSEARQNFVALLEQVRRDGAIRIRRRDGQSFVLRLELRSTSPLDIPGLNPALPISSEDIIKSIQESRRNYES